MKLILKEDVEKLGEAGEVVSVKPGFARNYLLPRDLAYEASPENIARLEEERKQAEERARRDYLEGRRRASQLEDARVVFQARASDEGKLFGSVTAQNVTDRLNEDLDLDFQVERREVGLDEAIKALGSYAIPIRLHDEVEVEVEVEVEPIEE